MNESEPTPQPNLSAPLVDAMPFVVLIDEAWRSTRAHVRTILVPAAVLMAPAALLMQLLAGTLTMSMVGADPARFEPSWFCGTIALAGLGLLLAFIYMRAVQGAVMIATVEALGGEVPAMRRCLRAYVRPRVWGTDLLAGFLTLLGVFLCVLPGVFLAAAWALRLPVMVRERRFGLAALSRSWDLLRHNPSGQWLRHPLLKVLLVFVLGWVLQMAMSMLVQMPAQIASQLMMVRAMAKGEALDPQALMRATLWLTIPAGVLAALVQLVVQLYVYFVTSHLYFDQVRRKEGADLGAALDRLAGGVAAPVAPPPAPAA